jgi:hypothetical protein
MPIAKLPAPALTRIEVEVSHTLSQALQKLAAGVPLSNAERFEIAALNFMVARALWHNKRAQAG